MSAAHWPAQVREAVRLLLVDGTTGGVAHHVPDELPDLLEAGDLLIVNDAATLPASLPAMGPGGAHLEVRLAEPPVEGRARAVLFGAGDWRADTDERGAPPPVDAGDVLWIGALRASVVAVDPFSPRLVTLRFEAKGDTLWFGLYAAGRPIQYRHLRDELALWSFQTVYAGPPWAVEMPSAGRPLTWATLAALRRRGVGLATLTHAAGLSATGDADLDARLPLPERTHIPASTVAAIERTRRCGCGRIIATGTTVVRALEGRVAEAGRLVPGESITAFRLDPTTRLRVVDGILTGMHERHESHYALLGAFLHPGTLERAWRTGVEAGYRSHEFGDIALVMAGPERAPGSACAA